MSKSVLIVEDERLLAKTLSSALQEAGYETTARHDATTADRSWCEKSFDLVILDHRLPEGSGLDVLAGARDRGDEAKVILVTAFGNPDVQAKAMALRVDKYMRKPFDLSRILETVHELIGAPIHGARQIPQGGG